MHLPPCRVELAPAALCHQLSLLMLHGPVCDLAFSSAAARLLGEMGARACVRACAGVCNPGVPNAAIVPWDWACMNSACPTMSSEMELRENPSRALAGSKSSGCCLFLRHCVFPLQAVGCTREEKDGVMLGMAVGLQGQEQD